MVSGPVSPAFWFFFKVSLLVYSMIWFRATWPRFRYDQLMNIGWRRLIPLGMAAFTPSALAAPGRGSSPAASAGNPAGTAADPVQENPAERKAVYKDIDRYNVLVSTYAIPNELAQAYRRLGARGQHQPGGTYEQRNATAEAHQESLGSPGALL